MENKLQEIDFHITDVCQGHCPMCYATEEGMCRTHGDIETLKKVVHNAIANGEVERFVMVGGDPCEHPQIMELLRYIKEEGKAHNVNTRTIVLSNTHIVPISHELYDSISTYCVQANSTFRRSCKIC